jgi:hypothetical protein
MQAEYAGRLEAASALFMQAWEAAADDYEACIAAHFVARHQPDPSASLHWNAVALKRAQAVADDGVRGFYPSLYLNLGYAHENVGDLPAARRYYDLAQACLGDLEENVYGDVVRGGVRAGLARLNTLEGGAP